MTEKTEATELLVRCDCGYEARGAEDQLIPAVVKHGREAHNMQVSREQVLAMSRPV